MVHLKVVLEIPFRLDSGADESIVSEEVLEQLLHLTMLNMRHCPEPQRCVLGDGSFRQISKVAIVDLGLHTDHGPVLAVAQGRAPRAPGVCQRIIDRAA